MAKLLDYLLLAKMLQPFQRQKNVGVNQHPMCDDTQSFFIKYQVVAVVPTLK